MVMAQQTARRTLPPLITASTWASVYGHAYERANAAHGMTRAYDGTRAPRLSNEEAVQLIAAWRAAAPEHFALWYQFAAVAYGWSPDHDELDASIKQAARAYLPADVDVALWGELYRIALKLDAEGAREPRAHMTMQFDDPVFAAEVAAALKGDGADPVLSGWLDELIKVGRKRPNVKYPCRDTRTGKYRDWKPGEDTWVPGKGGTCKPFLALDPRTREVRNFALMVGALWLLITLSKRRGRN